MIKKLLFTISLCFILLITFTSKSYADQLSNSVSIIYDNNNTVIGKIYPPFDLEAYYQKNSPNTLNLSFINYTIKIPPSASNYSSYQTDITIKNAILEYLNITGNISNSDYTEALQNESATIDENITDNYFTDYVINQLHKNYSNDLVQGGLSIHTTVDSVTYQMAQSVVDQDIKSYIAPNGGNSAALVASNPTNGYILALIGGPSWNTTGINMATVPRQQGSSMKPLIYIKGFEDGYSPQTIINDSPISFGAYTPTNYLNKYYGLVTIDQAINQSLNVCAVKMLYTIGYQQGIDMLEQEGISLDPNNYYGLPIILGDAEIPLTQMVGAYNALANGGNYAQTTPFIKITKQNGSVVLDNTNITVKRIMDINAVAMMDTVLGDTSMKQPMYGAATQYYSVQGRPYGSKDGTTNGPKDVTIYEFIPQITVGAWAGNTDNTNMAANATGAFVVGPIAHTFIMQYIQQNNLPVVNFQTPTYPTLDSSHKEID